MHIITSGKNFDITPSLRHYVEEKFERLGKFWSRIIRIHVELIIDHGHQHGDVCLGHAWIEVPGHDLRATVRAADMHVAVDLLYPKLERQIVRAKEKSRQR